MATPFAGWRSQVLVHVQEGGARNVAAEVELEAGTTDGTSELPPAVDELVAHGPIVTPRRPGGVSRP